MNSDNGIDFFMIIASRKKKDELLDALSQIGARVVSSLYAKGSADESFFIEAFGFAPEEHKIIITGLSAKDKTDLIMETLIKKFHFDKPNTGIVFSVHVEGLSY